MVDRRVLLEARRVLDPREADDARRRPLSDAVNIPFSKLADRVHELPPRDRIIRVAGPADLVDAVLAWLNARGRRGVAVETPPARGESDHSVGRLWAPNAFLEERLPEIPRGAALDLACGAGRDAAYLASCGWDVTGVDILPDALALARGLADRYAPALRPVRWMQLDLESDPPRFQREYDLIVMVRYLHRPLLERVHEWLRPGGSLIFETFTTLHRERHGKPSRDAHVLQPQELPELVGGLKVRTYTEGWIGKAHTARLWAVADSYRPGGP